MKEPLIISVLEDYFRGKGYETGTMIDCMNLVAVKDNEKWFIEAKGEWKLGMGYALYAAVGQIVRDMRSLGGGTRYAIAIAKEHFSYFRMWGVEGLKLLPIHLILIDESNNVEIKTPEEFVRLIEELKREECNSLRDYVNKNGGE